MFVSALTIRAEKENRGSTKYPKMEEWLSKLDHKVSGILKLPSRWHVGHRHVFMIL